MSSLPIGTLVRVKATLKTAQGYNSAHHYINGLVHYIKYNLTTIYRITKEDTAFDNTKMYQLCPALHPNVDCSSGWVDAMLVHCCPSISTKD